MNTKQFGGKVTPELVNRYARSGHWRDGQFQNLEETSMSIELYKIPGLIYKQLIDRKGREPEKPLPVIPYPTDGFNSAPGSTNFIWYGHSALLLRMEGLTILIDPMLGPDASPIAPFSTKRFSGGTLDLIDAFPEIDLLLLTHDHYDHLDLASFQKLKAKTKHYFVALGAARHLEAWGVSPGQITEFDWWDSQPMAGLEVTFTPTRHFSGRGLTDRAKCLWGGWALESNKEKIWFSGDGGYGEHFKAIGERHGPFDFAFMECGQYNENWRQFHLFPEESVQAALDAGVQKAMPVHWGGFSLAPHSWTDPAERFYAAARKEGLDFALPRIGQPFGPADELPKPWWRE